ncbi:PTS system transporter subunit IIB [Bacillus sp. TS-2]|nr:PTS system transporter subunit IIB [Bacillus sp. TS-2]
MNCFCDAEITYLLKVEADVGAEPIWCQQCGCNLDLDDITISSPLKRELMCWAQEYGEWIDWNRDTLLPNGVEMEDKHNKQGKFMTEKLKKELAGRYQITFSSSTMARAYASSNKF